MDLLLLMVAAVLTNNILLVTFLGICPFVGVSGDLESASGMAMAVIFVLTLTLPATWLINHFVLIPLGVEFLRFIAYIVVIAALVQVVEMFIERYSPALYNSLGIFLPLITVNCAILGATLFGVLWNFNFVQSAVFGFSAGVGWAMAILAMAAIRDRLSFANLPRGFEGAGITLIIAGLMALGFFGFSGMIDIQSLGTGG